MSRGCGLRRMRSTGAASKKIVDVVAAENEYGNVAAQIGGRYVTCFLRDEQSQHRPAHLRGQSRSGDRSEQCSLVIQNGVGYDDFMTKIENASPSSSRKVINVQPCWGFRITRRIRTCGTAPRPCRKWPQRSPPISESSFPRMRPTSRPMPGSLLPRSIHGFRRSRNSRRTMPAQPWRRRNRLPTTCSQAAGANN